MELKSERLKSPKLFTILAAPLAIDHVPGNTGAKEINLEMPSSRIILSARSIIPAEFGRALMLLTPSYISSTTKA